MSRLRRPATAVLTLALLGLLLTGLPVAPLADAQTATIVSNPGCESDTTGLQGYQAALTRTTAIKRTGAASCKATSTGGSVYSVGSVRSASNVGPGRQFTASAWVRADTNNGRMIYAALRERGGTTAARTVYGTGIRLSTGWQQVTTTLTVASAGRTAVDFYVAQDPGSSGHVFYADDLQFTERATSPSGQPMPVGDLPGWRQVFAEDFTKPAPTGSWGASCGPDDRDQEAAARKIVYTGTTGTQWRTYPDCYRDTYQQRPYRSDQVLSVHDGVLDFHLRTVDGQPAGANPSPVVNAATGSQYQTYGRYTARFKVDRSLPQYKVAWLLWPEQDTDGVRAESDWPEGDLGGNEVSAFAHHGPTWQDQEAASRGIDWTQWHTFTQEWEPGVRRYFLDDHLVLEWVDGRVYDRPERFQLQTETLAGLLGTQAGHLTVDWVAVYAYRP